MREGDRRLDRLANDILQVEAVDAFAKRGPEGMQKHDRTQLLSFRPESFEQWVVQLPAVDSRRNLDSFHPERVQTMRELLDGKVRVLECDITERHKAIRMARTGFGDALVGGA